MTAFPVTRVACLTPPGHGAIATIGVHGPSARETIRQLFRTRKNAELPATAAAGKFWLGRMGDEITDEVVLALKQVEPVPWFEVHCHGGREASRFLVDCLRDRGCVVCDWEEFLRHAESDPVRAAAGVALARAPTVRTAAILLDQQRGAFAAALADVRTSLERDDAVSAAARLKELAQWIPLGRHLTTPWRVAVVGAPNVGKSSLVNALAGYQRSVVAPTPGTTRDVLGVTLAIDGWPVELNDTAGLRDTSEALESAGIQRARQAAATADLCLWVTEASTEPFRPEAAGGAVRWIVNKVDLMPERDWSREGEGSPVSAKTGFGVRELCTAVGRWLVPQTPLPCAAVPFTEALCDLVREAQELVTKGRFSDALHAIERVRQGR